ncbi:MAG: short-chain dehydrogenase/reductase [Chloroflexi bacterium]|nr:short-chain dehydrogenase/reductase [Chloroflexota bacterium]
MNFDATRFSLEGKVALIVGGAGDLGHAIVTRFAQSGATVLLTSRKIENLQKVVDEVNSKGGKAAAFASHLGKSEEVKKMIDQVKAQYKTIDVLVNSAGANPQMVPLDELEEWAWDAVMNVNLKGTWLVSKEVVKMWKEQKKGGSIINMTSYQGFTCTENLSAYCTSKAAVAHLTKCMANEWGKYNVRVNAIAPGWIHSRLADPYLGLPGKNEYHLAKTALGFFGQPDDVALAALYLACDASSYTTGSTLGLDGGSLLGR